MPLFSVVIPLYNKENWIAETVQSVLCQTFSDFEIIVIDDGSTDRSVSIINKIQDEKIKLFSKNNEGAAAARNLGILKATGKYIAFLDGDDLWNCDYLQNMALLIEQFRDQDVFSVAIEIENNGVVSKAAYSIPTSEKPQVIDFFEGSMKYTALSSSSAVFKKSVFEKAGTFDPSLKTGEDTDLWIRIGLKYKIVFSLGIGARYRDAADSLSKNIIDYSQKPDFLKYNEFANETIYIRKYLDLNRFSIALKAKIAGDQKSYRRFKKALNFKNLTLKQRLLLHFPAVLLRKIYKLKRFLDQKNIKISAF